jgi:hypothetical protein
VTDAPRYCDILKALSCRASAGKSTATLQTIAENTVGSEKRLHDVAEPDCWRETIDKVACRPYAIGLTNRWSHEQDQQQHREQKRDRER